MAKQLNLNSSIENKIREFKEGADYKFTGEEYHAPNEVETKGYTVRNYDIKSPQLRKVVREMLSQQVAILMSFDFAGKSYVSEWLNRDETDYYCNIKDYYNGDNMIIYNQGKENNSPWLSIYHTENADKQKEQELAQVYQVAERAYNEKIKQNGSEPKLNIPPSGTKCWNCYEVITDSDISQERYRVENMRLSNDNFYRTFEHVKEHDCQAKNYDPAQRNNYRYSPNWENIWEKAKQKEHDYSCQDCLNKFRKEIIGNLIYLETYDGKESDITRTKQIINEIDQRLKELTENGKYSNCGIKLCCAEHDNCHEDNNHRELIKGNQNKNLLTGSNSSSQQKSNQLSTGEKSQLLQYFLKNGIYRITIENGKLVIEHNSSKERKILEADDQELQQIQQVIQNQNRQSVSLSELKTNSTKPNGNNYTLYVGLIIGGVTLATLALILVRKKLSAKKN